MSVVIGVGIPSLNMKYENVHNIPQVSPKFEPSSNQWNLAKFSHLDSIDSN
jgi:hypothetical protein